MPNYTVRDRKEKKPGDLPLTLEKGARVFFEFARQHPAFYRLRLGDRNVLDLELPFCASRLKDLLNPGGVFTVDHDRVRLDPLIPGWARVLAVQN